MAQNKLQLTPLLRRFAVHANTTPGARHLDEACRPRRIVLPLDRTEGEVYTTGCGGETRFEIPVDGDEGGDLQKAEPAVVCVIDDMAYNFPRYGGDEVTT